MPKNSEPCILSCDVRGQICPSTLLTALREINRHAAALRSGELAIAVLTDHRDAVETIPEAVANMGYRASVMREQGHYRVVIEGGGASTSRGETP